MNSAFLIWALPCWPPSAEKEARRALTIHPANRLESLFTVQSLLTDESAFTGIVLTNNTKRSPQQQWGFHWSSFEDLKKQQIGFFFFKSCLKKKLTPVFWDKNRFPTRPHFRLFEFALAGQKSKERWTSRFLFSKLINKSRPSVLNY